MSEYQDEKEDPKKTDILEIAKKRFEYAEEQEQDIRKIAKEDLEFAAGEQWDPRVKRQRDDDGRPTLTINRIPQFVRQIINDIRQNKPSIKVSPVDDKADVETGKILQGIIRHIEYSSNADSAYDRGADSAIRCGFGFIRIITEYDGPVSFDQIIKIKSVRNRFSCYLDPDYQEPDGSDANYAFAFEELTHEEFKRQYPKAELCKSVDWVDHVNDENWADKEKVRVAEYFTKEFEDKTIYLLSDKSVAFEEEIQAKLEEAALQGQPLGLVVDEATGEPMTRKTQVPVIKWYKLNGVEILEETTWPGQYIPIIPVLGEELDINGKRILEGVVRHAKDAQRMYNYQASNEAEAIALAPKAPYLGTVEQFEGHEEQWAEANRKNFAYLPFNNVEGQGAPQRQAFEPAIQAINQARMMAAEDLKATTGIYDAALGNKSNENSGVAIQRRAMQAQTSNFHFVDNLSKSIRHVGRILVDLIPKIYDTDRAIRILGEDGNEEIVRINEVFERKGKPTVFDLSRGKYDVTVNTGPSFETKRQEAVQAMLEFTKAQPQSAALIGDLLVKNMDWPGSADIAERLKKVIQMQNPGIIEDAKDGQKEQVPQAAQAQMQQMNQMIEQLTQQLDEKSEMVRTKSIEIESRERIAMKELEVKAEIEMAKLGSVEAIEMLRQDVAQIQRRVEMNLKFNEPIDFEGTPQEQQQEMPLDQNSTGGESPGLPLE